MGSFSIWHWLIVLAIVVLVFGTKKLKNMGSDLGGAVKGFKDGMKDGSANAPRRAQSAGHRQQGHRLQHRRRGSKNKTVMWPSVASLLPPRGGAQANRQSRIRGRCLMGAALRLCTLNCCHLD